jgi:hypothetical protein
MKNEEQTAEMKFMRRIWSYNLLDYRTNADILEFKADPVEKKLTQYNTNDLIMSAGWKTSGAQNDSMTIDLSSWTTVKENTFFLKRHLQSFADLWPTLMGFSIYI